MPLTLQKLISECRPSRARSGRSNHRARKPRRASRRLVKSPQPVEHISEEAERFKANLHVPLGPVTRVIRKIFPRLRKITIDAVQDPEFEFPHLRVTLAVNDPVATVLKLDEQLEAWLIEVIPSEHLSLLVVDYEFV